MKEEYKDKTKEQLINDLAGLRQRIAELEALENERKRAEEEEREALLKGVEETNRKLAERAKELEETRLATLNIAHDLEEARREAENAKEKG